jgi:hypothetical protein
MSLSPRALAFMPLLAGLLPAVAQDSAGASTPSPGAPRLQEPAADAALELPATPGPLEARDWSRLVDWLTPPEEELEWLEIGWAPTLGEGVRRAALEGRPLLLWAMNGHPLGCT